MKKFFVVALFCLLSTSSFAQSDNAALVVMLDEDCNWAFFGLGATGSVHYVETWKGRWTLACKGELTFGGPLDEAVVAKSTEENPLGICFTPFGVTVNWIAVFTPSGRSMFTCHDILPPP